MEFLKAATIRFTDQHKALYEWILERSDKEQRSFAAQVIFILSEAYAQSETNEKENEKTIK